jgi:D-glycero-beta-D-manno-heptose-7-phosphate kinase
MSVEEIFRSFSQLQVLIVGDVMIDMYFWGKVDRISPEAPVPIVSVTKKENRMGGAANVALNIQALGATPVLCSVVGNDSGSRLFGELMEKQGLSREGILQSSNRLTTVKTRIIGNNHQMLRVDEEMEQELSRSEAEDLVAAVKGILNTRKIDVILFEDYDKGVLNPYVIEAITTEARHRKIPVTVDPKKRNFSAYKNVTLLKPNLKELREGLKSDFDAGDIQSIGQAVSQLQEKQSIDVAMVTLSENGVYISNSAHKKHIPAYVRNIADVSGAGDTVISVASLCIALGLDIEQTATLANLAGGLVCEKIGVVAIDRQQLLEEAKELYNVQE